MISALHFGRVSKHRLRLLNVKNLPLCGLMDGGTAGQRAIRSSRIVCVLLHVMDPKGQRHTLIKSALVVPGGHLTSARRLCPLHHVLHTFPGHPQSLNFSWEDQTGFPMSRGGSPAESPRQSPPLLARVVRPGVTSIPGPGSAAEAAMPAPSSQRLLHPGAGKARATVPRCLRRPRLISPQGSRPPPTLSVFPICEAIRRKSLSFVIYPWREEKRECGRWRGERKGRKRAKSSVAPELGSSQEPLAKPWVLGLTWFVWKGFSRGQSGITLQIASSHGTGLYQQGLWWVGFRLGGYRGGLYEFWVCLNGKGQLPAC